MSINIGNNYKIIKRCCGCYLHVTVEHQFNEKKSVQNLCKTDTTNDFLFHLYWYLPVLEVIENCYLWVTCPKISNGCQKYNSFQSFFLFEVLTYLFVFGQSTQFKPRSNFPSLFSTHHSAVTTHRIKPYDLGLSVQPKFATDWQKFICILVSMTKC